MPRIEMGCHSGPLTGCDVEVDTETGQVTILDYVATVDCGTAIKSDAPPIKTILIPTYEPNGPFGAKSVSEIGINGPPMGRTFSSAAASRRCLLVVFGRPEGRRAPESPGRLFGLLRPRRGRVKLQECGAG